MKKRIFISMCLVAFLTTIITTAAILFAVFEDSRGTIKNQLVIEADYVKTAYEELGISYLNKLNRTIGGRLTVIATDGTVTFDSLAQANTMENHKDRPEFQAALGQGSGYASRSSETMDEETFYYALKAKDGAVIRVASTAGSLYAAVMSLLPWIIGIIVVVTLLAVLLANMETKRIVNPINAINLDTPEENEVYEEFSPLLVRMAKQRQQISDQIHELEIKQREFSVITQNMSEGLLIADKKGEVLSFNRGALLLCGYGAQPGHFVAGTSVFALNRDLDFCAAVDKALLGQREEHAQVINGRHCCFYMSPVESQEGISGVVIVIMDTTEKENREELRREFTANVSHELKTPLTSISGYAEIMKNGIAKDQDIRGFAEKIYGETQRLINLVADIIKLSRLDEAEGTLQMERCDLTNIASTSVKRLESAAGAAKVKLLVQGESAFVMGVPTMLEEMLYNLCDNGIKYNQPGGSVTVTVGQRGNQLQIAVTDTGIGIPKEDQARIFERFYRVDKSHSRITGGTGLGLSIVKHCVLLHGGEIGITSALQQGTTVIVTLPRA